MIRPICIFNKLERSYSLTAMASRLLPLRRLSRLLLKPPSSPPSSNFRPCFYLLEAFRSLHLSDNSHGPLHWIASRSFCSPPSNLNEGPAAIDYRYFPIFHIVRKEKIFLSFKGVLGSRTGTSTKLDLHSGKKTSIKLLALAFIFFCCRICLF